MSAAGILRWTTYRSFCPVCEMKALPALGPRRDTEEEAIADRDAHSLAKHISLTKEQTDDHQ